MVERRACVVAGLDRPELALNLLRNKPKHHGKGEQTAQENEVHEQSCRQRRLLCHLCTCCKWMCWLLTQAYTVAALSSTSHEQLAKSTLQQILSRWPDSSICWLLTEVSKLSKLDVQGDETNSDLSTLYRSV